jgi:hypothetical protein
MRRFRPHRGGAGYERRRPWRPAHDPVSVGAGWGRALRLVDGPLKPGLIVFGLIGLATLAMLMAVRDRGEDRAPFANRPARVSNGALELSPLQGWRATRRTPRLEGLEFDDPVVLEDRASGTRLVAGLLPFESSMLLPREFVQRARSAVAHPETTELGPGVEAYRFAGISAVGARGLVDVYAVPTTFGVATIACVAGSGSVWPQSDCSRNAATLKLRRGRTLRLGPDAAFRQRLPAAMLALEDARRRARAQLATRLPERQAAAASRLATTYRVEAAALAPLVPVSPPRSRALVQALTDAGRAYRAVVGALRTADTAAFRKRQEAVHASERRIDQLVELPGNE